MTHGSICYRGLKMLQTIREHTQGWIAGTVITIIILSFALWGIHSYFVGGVNTSIIAEVNGVEITKEQLAVAYERLRREVQIQYGSNHPLTAKIETALKEKALQSLIENEVLKQASTKHGYRISDRQIDNYLQSMPAFQVNGQFSLERFQEILSSTLLSTSEFLDLIKSSLLMDQPKLGIIFTSFALPQETLYTISLVNQERELSYMVIPVQYFLSQPLNITSAQIQSYYEQHKADFMTPEQVAVEYIELSLKDLAAQISPSDTMLKNFYNENVNSYMQAMQWKFASIEIPLGSNLSQNQLKTAQENAEQIATQMQTNTDMEKIAAAYSAQFTDSGWLLLNQLPVEWQKEMSGLTKPGQVSKPFKSARGLMIVKVLDMKEPKIEPFEAVKEKVKESYIRQHAEEKFSELRDRLADLAYEHPDSLLMVSKTLNLPIKKSELFSKEKAGVGLSQYKKIREVAFTNDVLNLQNNSDVVQVNPETAIVVHIKSHVASTLLPLKSIAKQIEGKLKVATAEMQAAQLAEEIKNKLQAGTDPQQLITPYHFSWVQAGFMGRYASKIHTAILDLAFRLPNPATVGHKVYGITRLPNGFAVVSLTGVRDGTVADKKQYSVFAEQVQNSEGLLEYELYKNSVMNNAKIKNFVND